MGSAPGPRPCCPALTSIFSWFRALETRHVSAANEASPGGTLTLKMPRWAEERSELLGSPFRPRRTSSKCEEETSSISMDSSLLHLICCQSAGGPDLHPDWTSTHVRSAGSVGSVPELNQNQLLSCRLDLLHNTASEMGELSPGGLRRLPGFDPVARLTSSETFGSAPAFCRGGGKEQSDASVNYCCWSQRREMKADLC